MVIIWLMLPRRLNRSTIDDGLFVINFFGQENQISDPKFYMMEYELVHCTLTDVHVPFTLDKNS
jgi:hypothetical protein